MATPSSVFRGLVRGRVAAVILSILAGLLGAGCATRSPNVVTSPQELADLRKEIEALEIRQQLNHNIREADAALRMRGVNEEVPQLP